MTVMTATRAARPTAGSANANRGRPPAPQARQAKRRREPTGTANLHGISINSHEKREHAESAIHRNGQGHYGDLA